MHCSVCVCVCVCKVDRDDDVINTAHDVTEMSAKEKEGNKKGTNKKKKLKVLTEEEGST